MSASTALRDRAARRVGRSTDPPGWPVGPVVRPRRGLSNDDKAVVCTSRLTGSSSPVSLAR